MKPITFCAMVLAVVAMTACKSGNNNVQSPQVEGHYTYEHAFNYDLMKCHLDVHETGTMDFQANGTAIDSARQVYVATLKDGGSATYVFNYVSPSRWRLNKKDFYFSGIKESFSMEVAETSCKGCDKTRADELAQEIIKAVGGSKVDVLAYILVVGAVLAVGLHGLIVRYAKLYGRQVPSV